MNSTPSGFTQAGHKGLSNRYDLDNLPTTRPEIEDMLARLEGEIAEISEQMLTEEGDDTWAARARAARRFRFRLKAKLERRLAELLPPKSNLRNAHVRVAEAKLEAQRLNAEAAKRKADAKTANVAATNARERRRLAALISWLREKHPELVEDAYAVMDEAEGA